MVNKHEGNGIINIEGIRSLTVTPAQLPEHPFAVVDILFVPSRIDFTVLEFTCPDRKGGTIITRSDFATGFISALGTAPALPISIRFEAKEGEQVLPGSTGRRGDKLFQKISVRQINDD